MAYKFEDQVRICAEEYVKALEAHGFKASIVPGSYRDYMVNIAVAKNGRTYGLVLIYYNEKNAGCSPKWYEMKDKSAAPELEAIWHGKSARDSEAGSIGDPNEDENGGYKINTDGSYQEGGSRVGYAAVVIKRGSIQHELSDSLDNISQRQVLGEIKAVCEAVQWCKAHHVAEVEIYYDYQGLESWATGAWKTNTAQTRQYAQFISTCGVQITWCKVKGHSGNRRNDNVDKLAKAAASDSVQAKTASAEREYQAELKQKAEEFVAFLNENGHSASLRDIFNGNCAQITVTQKGVSRGFLDIYHTDRKPFYISLHELKVDVEARADYERLWNEFTGGATTKQDSGRTAASLSEVEYYYTVLKPFAECQFDFSVLAAAVRRAAAAARLSVPPQETLRYDFRAIETLVERLRREN